MIDVTNWMLTQLLPLLFWKKVLLAHFIHIVVFIICDNKSAATTHNEIYLYVAIFFWNTIFHRIDYSILEITLLQISCFLNTKNASNSATFAQQIRQSYLS